MGDHRQLLHFLGNLTHRERERERERVCEEEVEVGEMENSQRLKSCQRDWWTALFSSSTRQQTAGEPPSQLSPNHPRPTHLCSWTPQRRIRGLQEVV